ncbi:MAG: adenosylcobinamide-GDP ribazoletransferase [Thermodesulfobacteriota bacterium]|nr:adenosylcobinamide-GDP ribazoletransferase [Thermodesulfobacteriota bacterium]
MRRFTIAVQFLTVFPLSTKHRFDEIDLGKSMLYFPLVGLGIGAILVCIRIPLSLYLPTAVTDALLITFLIVISGAMHLDALADTADAVFSGKDKSGKLKIMKDSAVGAMGVVCIVMVILLKYAALVALATTLKNKALLLMPLLGRWTQVIVAYTSDYAGLSKGLGFPFTTHVSLAILILTVLMSGIASLYLFSLPGLIVAGTVGVAALLYSFFFKWLLGGVTGDVLGASTELTEVVVLIFILAVS